MGIFRMKKYDLLSRAHIILVSAVRKGCGLVVTEANAMGTPAIGYDVSGLRDSLRYGETRINVIEKSPWVMAQQAISLLRDPKRLSNYSKNALEYARQFSRDKTVGSFHKFLDYHNETKAEVIMG